MFLLAPSEKKDFPYLRGTQYTRGYLLDGPNRLLKEISIDENMEPQDAETPTDAAVAESRGNFSGRSSTAVNPKAKKVSRKTRSKPTAKTYWCET